MSLLPLTISIPAWGAEYVRTAVCYTIPGIRAALEYAGYDRSLVTFICHTSHPEALAECLKGAGEIELRPVPAEAVPNGFHGLTVAHRETLRDAPAGGLVGLFNADILASREAFAFANWVAARGQKVVASVGVRSLVRRERPPIGAEAAELLKWVWRNKHPITEDCVWGRGKTHLPTNIFFETGGNVTLRCFHLCPVLLVKDRDNLKFKGTIDDDLLGNFGEGEIYVPMQRECSFAELSPATKQFRRLDVPISVDFLVQFGRLRFSRAHRRMFGYSIRILGDGPTDESAAFEISRRLGS